jgi:hypothetical protein
LIVTGQIVLSAGRFSSGERWTNCGRVFACRTLNAKQTKSGEQKTTFHSEVRRGEAKSLTSKEVSYMANRSRGFSNG